MPPERNTVSGDERDVSSGTHGSEECHFNQAISSHCLTMRVVTLNARDCIHPRQIFVRFSSSKLLASASARSVSFCPLRPPLAWSEISPCKIWWRRWKRDSRSIWSSSRTREQGKYYGTLLGTVAKISSFRNHFAVDTGIWREVSGARGRVADASSAEFDPLCAELCSHSPHVALEASRRFSSRFWLVGWSCST